MIVFIFIYISQNWRNLHCSWRKLYIKIDRVIVVEYAGLCTEYISKFYDLERCTTTILFRIPYLGLSPTDFVI